MTEMKSDFRQVTINDCDSNEKQKFKNNIVHTNKYTPLNFLPLFLVIQFQKYSNLFFLFCGVIEGMGDFLPPGMVSSFFPLTLVFGFSALRDIYEDIKRRIHDNTINNLPATILTKSGFEETIWSNLKVGDIIRVETDRAFPADLVLLSSSEPQGLAYLETSNLDGESNLKLRMASPKTLELTDPDSLRNLTGHINCEHPNPELYHFEGSMITNDFTISLDHNNLLPRGAILRNARWIIGVVIYTGHESRIMMNANKDPVKLTKFETQLNNHLLFYVSGFIAFVIALSSANWYYRNYMESPHWYLHPEGSRKMDENIFHYMAVFMILFCTVIPISLYVTIEFVRLLLGVFISNDLQLYDQENDVCAVAKSSNLVEELGQVQYVLTDKTGTLTRNEMIMKHLIIDGQVYHDCTDSRSNLMLMLSQENRDTVIDRFLSMLSVCHTVMIDALAVDASKSYQASSPDELAIVTASKQLGYVFDGRSVGSITVSVCNKKRQFGVCAVIEFTSARKRMSVVVQSEDGRYFLFTKGADSIILERLSGANSSGEAAIKLNASMKYLEEFASQGLRTLCFAYREIDQSLAVEWLDKWSQALNTVSNRQAVIDQVAAEIEHDLTFIGATGVEDRLQDGVPDTINSLFKANINIWMLTGDRFETAVSTAYLAGLCDSQTKQLLLLDADKTEIVKSLNFYASLTSEAQKGIKFAMVINGPVVSTLLSDELEAKDKVTLKTVILRCRTLLCCRLSPLQKAQITEFVKNELKKVTLAIGDGGNDVSMIQAANVGVGISGKEGLQASRSADFAIGQFKFLKRLVLVHGAWAIYRVSRLVMFALYKNILIYLFNFCYSFYTLFSGATLIDGTVLSDWNLYYTSWAPTILGLTDQHVCADDLMRHPQLYQFGQKGKFMEGKVFWASAFNAVCQSVIVFVSIYLMFNDTMVLPQGHPSSIYYVGNVAFGAILLIAISKSFLMMNYMTPLMLSSVVVGSSLWFIKIGYTISAERDYAVLYSFKTLVFWVCIALITVIALSRDFLWKFYLRQFRPLPYHIVQEFQMARTKKGFKEAYGDGEVNQVYSGHDSKPRTSRGFSFAQSYGQSKVLEAYQQSPRSSKSSLSKENED